MERLWNDCGTGADSLAAMLPAAIDWVAIGAAAGAVAALVAIPASFAAWRTARQAKRQAGAAEKLAALAEADQRRATDPSLRIARWPHGHVKVQENNSEATFVVYVENLRPVPADLGATHLNGQLGRLIDARCTDESNACVEFDANVVQRELGSDNRFEVEVLVPEDDRRGTFTATLYLQGGGWNARHERLNL